MNSHTPGHWVAKISSGYDADGNAFEPQHQIVAPHCEVATGIQCSEDARLIAAAPELLAALRLALAALDADVENAPMNNPVVARATQAWMRGKFGYAARAAIAKAIA